MIVIKEIITTCACIGLSTGVFVGGIAGAWSDYRYDSALNDPEFLYLVDELGNPVRQELN